MSTQIDFAPGRVHQIPLDRISPDMTQPRKVFHEKPLQALADNIRARGVMQAIVVRLTDSGSLVIKVGERRFRAARIAGLETIPAIVVMDPEPDADTLLDQITENELREGLGPLELAAAYGRLRAAGMSPQQISEHCKSHGIEVARSTVSNTLRLLELPQWAKKLVNAGEIGAAHARHILTAKDHRAWLDSVRKVYVDYRRDDAEQGVTVNEMEHLVSRALQGSNVSRRLDGWPAPRFDWQDVCKSCPKFVKHGHGHYCLSPPDYDRRQSEAIAAAPAAAKGARSSNPQSEQEKKAKRERAFRSALYEQLRPKLPPPTMRELAAAIFDRLEHDVLIHLCKVRNFEPPIETRYGTKHRDYRAVGETVATMPETELVGFINDCIYVREIQVSTWSDSKPEKMLAAAAACGVDVAAVRKSVEPKASKAKAKAKKRSRKAENDDAE